MTNGAAFPSLCRKPDPSLKEIYKGGEQKAYDTFKRLRWSQTTRAMAAMSASTPCVSPVRRRRSRQRLALHVSSPLMVIALPRDL